MNKFAANIFYNIRSFFRSLKRSCKYFKIMWSNYPYDYSYLLSLEREKLKDMYKYFSNANIIEDEWIRARDCKLAIALLDIILGDDSSYDIYWPAYNKLIEGKYNIRYTIRKYVNDSNINRFLDRDVCKKYRIESSKKNNADNLPIIIRDDLRIEKAWNLYCKLREYRLRTWWD